MFSPFYNLFGLTINDPAYENSIFMFIGLCLLFVPAIFSLIFYLVANGFRQFAKMRFTSYWILFMVLSMLTLFALTIIISRAQAADDAIDSVKIALGIINSLLSVVVYLLASLFIKGFSLHAKYVPFKYTLLNK